MDMKRDLELTRELCRQEGVLGPELQDRYSVIRGGIEVMVPRDGLTHEEIGAIADELNRRGRAALAEADSLERNLRGPKLVQ
jgi:hypothetical protein